MKDVFCAYTDARFLVRAAAMADSLRRARPDASLWLLALDEKARQGLGMLALPGVAAISLGELESFDPGLLAVKSARTPMDYALTLTPVLPAYVLSRDPRVQRVTYLDADLFFYADPAEALEEVGDASASVTPHDFSSNAATLARAHGVFNDGWTTVRNDAAGAGALAWWRERCLRWCHNRCEEGLFTEQKYLDEWPRLVLGFRPLGHPGANVGHWNVASRALRLDPAGRLMTRGRRLLCYHFSGFRRLFPGVWRLNLGAAEVPDTQARRALVVPYLDRLARFARSLGRSFGEDGLGLGGRGEDGLPRAWPRLLDLPGWVLGRRLAYRFGSETWL